MKIQKQKYEISPYYGSLSDLGLVPVFKKGVSTIGDGAPLRPFLKHKDSEKFTKCFVSYHELVFEAPLNALRVLSYLAINVDINENAMVWDSKSCNDILKYKNIRDVNKGFAWLLEKDVIRMGEKEKNVVFINPFFIFNGSRVDYIKQFKDNEKF